MNIRIHLLSIVGLPGAVKEKLWCHWRHIVHHRPVWSRFLLDLHGCR